MKTKGSSQNFRTQKLDTTVFHEETALATAHQTLAAKSRTFPAAMGWHLFLAGLVLLSVLQVQCANAAVNFRPEYSCSDWKNSVDSMFRRCNCGQFATPVTANEAANYKTAGIRVFKHIDEVTNKKQHYVCDQCIHCGDGIRIDKQCTQRSDTKCSKDECADSTWLYNYGLKACKPPTTTHAPTMTTLLTKTGPHGPQPSEDTNGTPIASPGVASDFLRNHAQAIIIGVVVLVVALLVCIVAMMAVIVRLSRQMQEIVPSGTPYSSHNTSKSSVV